jgi:hypothetical protein
MRCLLWCCLCAACFFLFCGTSILSVRAAELPDHGSVELQKILSQPEFHGRQLEESIWQKLLTSLAAKVRSWVKQIVQMFEGLTPVDLSNTLIGRVLIELGKALERVFDVFAVVVKCFRYLFWPGVLVCLLYLAYRFEIWRYLAQHIKQPEPGSSAAALTPTPAGSSLQDLLSSGSYMDALAVMRRGIRGELSQTYGFFDSVTDREMMRLLPGSENKKAVFSQVAMLFERLIFAGQPLEEKEVALIKHLAVKNSASQVQP